jgi:hypothetical protein
VCPDTAERRRIFIMYFTLQNASSPWIVLRRGGASSPGRGRPIGEWTFDAGGRLPLIEFRVQRPTCNLFEREAEHDEPRGRCKPTLRAGDTPRAGCGTNLAKNGRYAREGEGPRTGVMLTARRP